MIFRSSRFGMDDSTHSIQILHISRITVAIVWLSSKLRARSLIISFVCWVSTFEKATRRRITRRSENETNGVLGDDLCGKGEGVLREARLRRERLSQTDRINATFGCRKGFLVVKHLMCGDLDGVFFCAEDGGSVGR